MTEMRWRRERGCFAEYRDDQLKVCCAKCQRTLGTVLGSSRIEGFRPCWFCRLFDYDFVRQWPQPTIERD